MKDTEWFHDHSTGEWWMVSVTTNSDKIPTLRLPNTAKRDKPNAKVYGVNLIGENKKLWRAVAALAGCLGVSLAVVVLLLMQ
jgi:hypothetical protein